MCVEIIHFNYEENRLNYTYRESLLTHFSTLGQMSEYEKGMLIVLPDDEPHYVYLIMDGLVKQSFMDAGGIEKTFLILSKGDMFGEITLFQRDNNHCITKAHSRATICRIPSDSFEQYLAAHPFLYNNILIMLSTKIRVLMYQIFDGSYLNTKEKLYALLLRLSKQEEARKNAGNKTELHFTHEEIAFMIGSTRSTVTKLMKSLEDEGRIKRSGKRILLLFASESAADKIGLNLQGLPREE